MKQVTPKFNERSKEPKVSVFYLAETGGVGSAKQLDDGYEVLYETQRL